MRALIALIALSACATAPPAARIAAPGEAVLSLMTFNLNYGLAGDPATLEAIGAEDADVVLLQEVNEPWAAAIRARWSSRWPHMAFFPCCVAGGLGVLSKQPIVSTRVLPKVSWFPALQVIVATPLGEVQFLDVHLRPPFSDGGSAVSGYFSTPRVRAAEISAFLAALDPSRPTVVAGDFNEWTGGAHRELSARGFTNVVPESVDTWRWNTSLGEVRSSLDHVWHDAHFDPLEARVLAIGRSDHLPVITKFVRRP